MYVYSKVGLAINFVFSLLFYVDGSTSIFVVRPALLRQCYRGTSRIRTPNPYRTLQLPYA